LVATSGNPQGFLVSSPKRVSLNNLVEQYLVFAEGQAMRGVPMPINRRAISTGQ